MKIECPICNEKFRHRYLFIRHVRDKANEEDIMIKENLSKYGPHLSIFNKILGKIDDKIKQILK